MEKWTERIKGFYCDTPLGRFKVFESIGGKTFYEYPIIKEDIIDEKVISIVRFQCKTLDEGIKKCDEIWEEFKMKINDI